MSEKKKQRGWLALTVDDNTEVRIGDDITVRVGRRDRSGRVVKVAIRAPRDVKITREPREELGHE